MGGGIDKAGIISREKLYEEVWAEPVTTVAERYNVSGSFLARICTRLKVPRPSRGYWAMLAAGKRPRKLPLPEARPGDELEWVRSGYASGYARAKVAQFPSPACEQIPFEEMKARKKLPGRHPILCGAKEIIAEGKELDSGLLKPRKYILPDVIASKATLDRALEVANALYLSLEKRGHCVVMEPYGQHFKHQPVDEYSGPHFPDNSLRWCLQ